MQAVLLPLRRGQEGYACAGARVREALLHRLLPGGALLLLQLSESSALHQSGKLDCWLYRIRILRLIFS